MLNAKTKRYRPRSVYEKLVSEPDGVYVLKLVGILVLGTFWVKLAAPLKWSDILITGIPVGAIAAIILIRVFEKNFFDRKIWYAVLAMSSLISYFVPAGIVV